MNTKQPSVQLNMLMNVILTLSSVLFPLITLPYVTRVLGPEAIGRVYFASSVVTILSVFAELGIPVYGIRACAKVRDDRAKLSRTVREILTINLITCLAVYIILAAMLVMVPRFAENRSLMVIMSSLIVLNAIGVEWLYKALEKYTYITVRSLIFKLIALAAMFMLVREQSDFIVYGALTIFAAAASNVLNFINMRRYVDPCPAIQPDLKQHLPSMLVLFALAAAAVIYTNLDLAFLDYMKGDSEAGLYGVAVKIKLVLVNIITAVSAVLLPRMSFYYEKGRKGEFDHLLHSTLTAVEMISIPAALYFVIYAEECILLLAGNEFAGAVTPMRIIVPAVVFIGISNVVGMQMLVPIGREDIVVRAAWTGAATDVILNIILIPRFASAGAAAATLTAELLVMTSILFSAKRLPEGKTVFCMPDMRIIVSAVCAGAVAVFARNLHAGLFPRLVIGAVSCFGIYIVIMIVLFRLCSNRGRAA